MNLHELSDVWTQLDYAQDEMAMHLRELEAKGEEVDHKDPLRQSRRALDNYESVLAWLMSTTLRVEVDHPACDG